MWISVGLVLTLSVYESPDGYMSSPERSTRQGYEEPYYSQYGTRGPMNSIISEEHG